MKSIKIYRTEFLANEAQGLRFLSSQSLYDDQEHLLEEKEFDAQGNILRSLLCTYTVQGNPLTETELDAAGLLIQKHEYQENDKGEIVLDTHIFADDSKTIKSFEITVLEDGGKRTEVTITDEEDELMGKEVLIFAAGEVGLLSAVEFDQEGEEGNRVERAYSKDGDLLEEKKYYAGDLEYTRKFSYAAPDQVLKMITTDGEGSTVVEEDYFYDEAGRMKGTQTKDFLRNYESRSESKFEESGNTATSSMYREGKLIYKSESVYRKEGGLAWEDSFELNWETGKLEHYKLEYLYEDIAN